MRGTITWLHLSDLHFQDTPQHKWNADIVLDALLKDAQALMADEALRLGPDFIVVTGDIAFGGAKAEYDLAAEFLDRLLAATDLDKSRLFVVPGNHDVDRKAITRGAKALAATLAEDRDAIGDVLTTDADRSLLLGCQASYRAFLGSYFAGLLPADDSGYWYVRDLAVSGHKIAVLGLNSAWLAHGRKEEHGNLALGEVQVRAALDAAPDAELRLALLHHPFQWLSDADKGKSEALLSQECRFILHGHLHTSGLTLTQTPDARSMTLGAGACFDGRANYNACNWVRLDSEANQGQVYLREYSDSGGGFWVKDVRTYRNAPDGMFTFELELRATLSVGAAPTPTPTLPPPLSRADLEANYLRRMQIACNALPLPVIDPRALEQMHQQAMNLSAVYVGLETETWVQTEFKKQPKDRPRVAVHRLTALGAASRERLLVLLGDPGSGKSTFESYLALCLAGSRLEAMGQPAAAPGKRWLKRLARAWTYGALLPVRVILRDFGRSATCDGTAAGLWAFIEKTLAAEGLPDFSPHLRQYLAHGGVLVLLDGLDEVDDLDRWKGVRAAVTDFVRTYNHRDNRYLGTCRGYAYQDRSDQLEDFVAYTVAPFSEAQTDEFIRYWYGEIRRLGWKEKDEAERLTALLQKAVRRPDLAELASNPLQLTMMATLHFSGGQLPDDRAELYQEMVRLLLVRWQESRLGAEVGLSRWGVKPDELVSALKRVAFQAHGAQSSQGVADIGEALLIEGLKSLVKGSRDQAAEIVQFIKTRAGLLKERVTGIYTFPHRSYQEYLAGAHLCVQPDFPMRAKTLASENYTNWHEVILWAIAIMARGNRMISYAMGVVERLCPGEVGSDPKAYADWQLSYLSGEALLEIGVDKAEGCEGNPTTTRRVRDWLEAMLGAPDVPPTERAAAGRVLAKLRDERPGVGVRVVNRVTVPDIELCYVPPGPFWMGEGESLHLYEGLDRGFWIGRYPVTNGQFGAFVQAGGYGVERYWFEATAAEFWCPKGFKGPFDERMRAHARGFGETFTVPNHPIVYVTWYEALAFTRWLTDAWRAVGILTADWQATLPSEAEWEKAARGGVEIPAEWIIRAQVEAVPMVMLRENPKPRRAYPWEGDAIDPNRANYRQTGINATSTVGCFPLGASPYGCQDLAGNVWDWTRTLPTGYPYAVADGREMLEAGPDEFRVMRGGAFRSDDPMVRCAHGSRRQPYYFRGNHGFRVVVIPA